MDYNGEASDLAPTADPYMTVSRPTRRPTRAHEAARNRSGRATTAATVALLPAQAWPRPAMSMANRPIAQRSPEQSAGGRTGRSEMSVYMRGYDRGQERGRAEVGLSGDHAPSDAGKSLPGLVMMVGKPMVKLSGIFPGQLHPGLALSVQPRRQAAGRGETHM